MNTLLRVLLGIAVGSILGLVFVLLVLWVGGNI